MPSKFVKKRTSLPWLNKNIIKLVKKQSKLFKKINLQETGQSIKIIRNFVEENSESSGGLPYGRTGRLARGGTFQACLGAANFLEKTAPAFVQPPTKETFGPVL